MHYCVRLESDSCEDAILGGPCVMLAVRLIVCALVDCVTCGELGVNADFDI